MPLSLQWYDCQSVHGANPGPSSCRACCLLVVAVFNFVRNKLADKAFPLYLETSLIPPLKLGWKLQEWLIGLNTRQKTDVNWQPSGCVNTRADGSRRRKLGKRVRFHTEIAKRVWQGSNLCNSINNWLEDFKINQYLHKYVIWMPPRHCRNSRKLQHFFLSLSIYFALTFHPTSSLFLISPIAEASHLRCCLHCQQWYCCSQQQHLST